MKLSSRASGMSLRLFLSQLSISIICLCIFTACATATGLSIESPSLSDTRELPRWTELASPINYYRYQSIDKSKPLIYHIVSVQLDDPSISIQATKPVQSNWYKTIGQTTKKYVAQSDAFFAINASPFTYPASIFSAKRDIVGLYAYEGVIVSQANKQYAALCFAKDKSAFIVNSQTENKADTAWFAFGGFWTILEQQIIYPFKNNQEARTAVGISEDGFTLYILTVEKNKKSTGLSFMECAQILQQVGADTAIQLDGGGSTSLVFRDFPQYSVFSSRKVATNLGFFLQP